MSRGRAELPRLHGAGGAPGSLYSCVSLPLLHKHPRTVHARRMPVVASPLGPPSARGEPSPAHLLVAARARSRATGDLAGIAVASNATFWTPLLLTLGAR
jgi:hypothetical protein